MRRSSLKLFITIGITGPIFYFALLIILGLLWEGYDPIATGMSELGAVGSPFKDVMNYLGFSFLGLSIMCFSLGFKVYFGNNVQLKIAQTLLLLGGLVMFLVGFLPCDQDCIDVSRIGRLHSLMSTITAILIPLGLMVSAQPISIQWNNNWGYASFYMGVLSLAGGPIMFLESMAPFSGLVQRLGLGSSLLWMVLISAKILLGFRRQKLL